VNEESAYTEHRKCIHCLKQGFLFLPFLHALVLECFQSIYGFDNINFYGDRFTTTENQPY
jgi:hypothetical protein